MEKKNVVRFITKERFMKVKDSGNYGEVSSEADAVISNAKNMDILELRLQQGSAYKVISATTVDEKRYMQILKD